MRHIVFGVKSQRRHLRKKFDHITKSELKLINKLKQVFSQTNWIKNDKRFGYMFECKIDNFILTVTFYTGGDPAWYWHNCNFDPMATDHWYRFEVTDKLKRFGKAKITDYVAPPNDEGYEEIKSLYELIEKAPSEQTSTSTLERLDKICAEVVVTHPLGSESCKKLAGSYQIPYRLNLN